jgi:hypothetical protein
MNHHRWASKQLVVPVALALAFAPAGKTAKSPSRFHLDGKAGSSERVSAPPLPSDHNSGAQEAAPHTSPPSATVAGRPTIKPPQVTYEDGELTIIAENSSLAEVMKALRATLGADIDLPANVVDQHIWVRLGPGPARRVLRDLLDGTEFNYVIQASDSDPDGIRSVLLTPRGKSAAPDTAEPPERAATRRIPHTGPEPASATDSETPTPEPVASVDPPPATSPTSPVTSPVTSAATSPANGSSDSASLQNTPSNSSGSRTDEMIQQLQSMYQQRRQLQIQQNQKPTGQN